LTTFVSKFDNANPWMAAKRKSETDLQKAVSFFDQFWSHLASKISKSGNTVRPEIEYFNRGFKKCRIVR
jgi:hypothetical protein